MSKLKLYIISANMLLVLGFFFFNIMKNERVLDSGETVLMELRPVDPRSLMQGDYMALRYSVGDSIFHTSSFVWNPDDNGSFNRAEKYCVVRLDKDRVGKFVRLTNDKDDVNDGEIILRYSEGKSAWEHYIYFGADSYFFQEGTGEKYASARYGMLKVVTKGSLAGTCNLVGLCGEDKELIK